MIASGRTEGVTDTFTGPSVLRRPAWSQPAGAVPDGARLVTTVGTLDPGGRSSSAPCGRSTRAASDPRSGSRGRPQARPTPLSCRAATCSSKRPDAEVRSPDADEEVAAVWLLPVGGGEARQIASRPGGIDDVAVAKDSGTVVLTAPVLSGATSSEDDKERRKARKDADVHAVLHEGYPVRYWDHDLGPDELRLYAAAPPTGEGRLDEPRDLTPKLQPGAGRPAVCSRAGRLVRRHRLGRARTWRRHPRRPGPHPHGYGGAQRRPHRSGIHDFYAPAVSPDGTRLVRRGSGGRSTTSPST